MVPDGPENYIVTRMYVMSICFFDNATIKMVKNNQRCKDYLVFSVWKRVGQTWIYEGKFSAKTMDEAYQVYLLDRGVQKYGV